VFYILQNVKHLWPAQADRLGYKNNYKYFIDSSIRQFVIMSGLKPPEATGSNIQLRRESQNRRDGLFSDKVGSFGFISGQGQKCQESLILG